LCSVPLGRKARQGVCKSIVCAFDAVECWVVFFEEQAPS
jgi:hypothetical protein